MLNRTDKFIVYLDSDTLYYLYLDYTGERQYPVMKKLYATLRDGYVNNWLTVPLSMDHIIPYISDNKIDKKFLDMMGTLGQVVYHQRFTIKTLQLIRIINSFFDNPYSKPLWRDVFTSNPDEKYYPGFNKYASLNVQHVQVAVEREKKTSQIHEFIESYRNGNEIASIAGTHFGNLLTMIPDLITPYLPKVGDPDLHIKDFLEYKEIREIPEFHIISHILQALLDAYGLQEVESGQRDEVLLAAETIASYLPYCHFYVTTVDIAELMIMTGIHNPYNVRVYDHNESSLYQLIKDIVERNQAKQKFVESKKKQSQFRRGLTKQ